MVIFVFPWSWEKVPKGNLCFFLKLGGHPELPSHPHHPRLHASHHRHHLPLRLLNRVQVDCLVKCIKIYVLEVLSQYLSRATRSLEFSWSVLMAKFLISCSNFIATVECECFWECSAGLNVRLLGVEKVRKCNIIGVENVRKYKIIGVENFGARTPGGGEHLCIAAQFAKTFPSSMNDT